MDARGQKLEYFLPEVEADLVLLLLVAACWPASAAAFWPTLPKVELFSWSVTIAIFRTLVLCNFFHKQYHCLSFADFITVYSTIRGACFAWKNFRFGANGL